MIVHSHEPHTLVVRVDAEFPEGGDCEAQLVHPTSCPYKAYPPDSWDDPVAHTRHDLHKVLALLERRPEPFCCWTRLYSCSEGFAVEAEGLDEHVLGLGIERSGAYRVLLFREAFHDPETLQSEVDGEWFEFFYDNPHP